MEASRDGMQAAALRDQLEVENRLALETEVEARLQQAIAEAVAEERSSSARRLQQAFRDAAYWRTGPYTAAVAALRDLSAQSTPRRKTVAVVPLRTVCQPSSLITLE